MIIQSNKTEVSIVQEKEQEQKKISTIKHYAGQKLYGLNPDTLDVYKVEIEIIKTFRPYSSDLSQRRANIDPNHKYLWAINLKNAKRKFKNQII